MLVMSFPEAYFWLVVIVATTYGLTRHGPHLLDWMSGVMDADIEPAWDYVETSSAKLFDQDIDS